MASDAASMNVKSGLRLDAVTVLRGIKPVIHEFSNHLEYGQLGLVHGANGAGKTTLLRAIAGRLAPESGVISCAPAAYAKAGDESASGDAARLYVGHQDGLSSLLRGRENSTSVAELTG